MTKIISLLSSKNLNIYRIVPCLKPFWGVSVTSEKVKNELELFSQPAVPRLSSNAFAFCSAKNRERAYNYEPLLNNSTIQRFNLYFIGQ